MDPLRGYAVHFTRGASPDEVALERSSNPPTPLGHLELMDWLRRIDDTGFRVSLSILWEGHIRATSYPLGVGALVSEVAAGHRSACFSETPLDNLTRLISTRSLYGVGFRQEFLHRHGGRPVRYLEAGSGEARRYEEEVLQRVAIEVDPRDPFWEETPFVDLADNTSWEQEWRVPGGLNFSPNDVAFCFLPAHLHNNARQFFEEHRAANTGPAYLGPYLDPNWDRAKIERVLRSHPGAEPR